MPSGSRDGAIAMKKRSESLATFALHESINAAMQVAVIRFEDRGGADTRVRACEQAKLEGADGLHVPSLAEITHNFLHNSIIIRAVCELEGLALRLMDEVVEYAMAKALPQVEARVSLQLEKLGKQRRSKFRKQVPEAEQARVVMGLKLVSLDRVKFQSVLAMSKRHLNSLLPWNIDAAWSSLHLSDRSGKLATDVISLADKFIIRGEASTFVVPQKASVLKQLLRLCYGVRCLLVHGDGELTIGHALQVKFSSDDFTTSAASTRPHWNSEEVAEFLNSMTAKACKQRDKLSLNIKECRAIRSIVRYLARWLDMIAHDQLVLWTKLEKWKVEPTKSTSLSRADTASSWRWGKGAPASSSGLSPGPSKPVASKDGWCRFWTWIC
uniref:Uncharacterized protein n=1 Tax=Cafeteria roenbergensis TaxID=33653 RepID=A0A7S0PAD0_CAFRO|mmetsp:Transcript_16692/g.63224  ORF Transcript_16692/g.63224 Transcript_16692/m.63224 type:complete len:383 (+) Transcript_16692:106-1254(+)